MSRPPRRPLRRRLDHQLLRLQGRFDAAWADRYLPWLLACGVCLTLFSLAWAHYRSLDTGAGLAHYLQMAWKISASDAPRSTIAGSHLLADQVPLLFYPIAWSTRVLPAAATLLGIQAAALGAGIIPLWRIARKLAGLRVGAALALTAAYTFSVSVDSLNLTGFLPEAIVLPALLAMTYFGLQCRWRWFAVFAAIAVLCRADVGLVVAGFGLLVALKGHRRKGAIIAGVGLAWVVIAVVVIEPEFGLAALVDPGAFADYGGTSGGVIRAMLANPFRVVGDLAGADNLALLISVFAPLLFLPVLAPRYLLPVVPLQLLYLVSDVAVEGPAGAEYVAPVTAFAFVAAAFALSRIGRRSLERVLVDRRVLLALVVASVAFFARDATASPYAKPWTWGRRDAADGARLAVVAQLDATAAVRASREVLPLAAERSRLYTLQLDAATDDGLLDNNEAAQIAARAARRVDAIVVDQRAVPSWSTEEWTAFRSALGALDFERVFAAEGIELYVETDS